LGVIFLKFVFQQLVDDLPPYPCPELSAFLSSLSLSWPPLFYKPFFACAASDKEVIVVNHLCTIQLHAKYVSNYWTRDSEMLCIALLSDIGMADLGSIDGKWGTARLGQLILLVELIGNLQKLRHERDASVSTRIIFLLDITNQELFCQGSDVKFHDVLRFVTTLESRLWNMIEVKVISFHHKTKNSLQYADRRESCYYQHRNACSFACSSESSGC